MSIPRVLAGLCAVAGVAVLAGPGWGLLAAAAILYVTPVTPRLRAAADRAWSAGAAVWRWLVNGRGSITGRQAKAAAAMPLAVVALAVGLGLAVGVGWGIAAAGVAVGGLSLAADKAE